MVNADAFAASYNSRRERTVFLRRPIGAIQLARDEDGSEKLGLLTQLGSRQCFGHSRSCGSMNVPSK